MGAVVYAYVDRDRVTESEKKSRASNVFPAWRREELTRLAIDHDGESIVLERSKDDAGDPEWRMRAPFDHEKANQEAVDKLASVLEFANVVRKVDASTPASATKIDAPRAHGVVAMGALSYRFALGGDAPTPEGAAYLRVDDLGTVVVTRDVVTALMQKSDAYRSRSLVPYLSIELARLDVKSDAGTVAITRADDVSFTLGNGLRASRSKLDTIWSALAEMRADVFVGDAVAAPLVATPRVTIAMTPKDATRPAGVLRVGGACPANETDIVVTRDAPTKLAACAPKAVLEGLATNDAALVDARLFAAHDDEIAELRIETLPKGAAVELARKESAWREKAPMDRDLSGEDAEAASALVAAIARGEGIDPQKSDAPFDAKGRITVHRADNDVTEVIDVGAPDANGDVIVRRAFDGARLHVSAAVARKLVPSAIALRGKELWGPRIEGAPVTAIETHCDGVDQRATHDADAWTMRTPADYGVDNAAVTDAIDAATRARAESWIADADEGRFGFGSCAIALEVASDGGARTARIEFGREGEGGVYARTSDGPAVFVAPRALRDRARAWLVDLHGFAPPDVALVTLERNGKRLGFSADAGDDTTDAILRAANVLRADSVVHLGAPLADEGFGQPSLVLTISGKTSSKRITFGREAVTNDAKTVLARVTGIEATFAVDRDRVKAFFDRF